MSNKTLDLDKPVQTKTSTEYLPTRIIYTEAKGDYPIIALYTCKDGGEFTFQCTRDGFNWANKYTLVNAPEKVTKWVNIYPNNEAFMSDSKEQADRLAADNRIACVKIEYTEG